MPTLLDLREGDLAPPEAPERSAGEYVPREARHRTILLVARLLAEGGDDQLCRVRNISSGGLMLETSALLYRGQRVDVQLRDLCTLRGAVAWARSPQAGIQLDSPADVSELLRSLASKGPHTYVPRSPRLSTECPVEVRCHGTVARACLLDLSQRGARLHASGRAVDEQITVRIPGFEPQRAAVRWAREDHAGVSFLETLPFQALDRWLQDRDVRYAARVS
jgi:hypothetical protein